MIRAKVRSGMANASVKGARIGQPQITKDNIPTIFLRHYPAYKSGHLNISELSRVCDLSRTTIYISFGDISEPQRTIAVPWGDYDYTC